MQRCLQLAALGAGNVAPNPMVGAVLVHKDTIIGEGYHVQYGQPHAEVNCINSVKEADRHLIKESVLYVSLEPCNHFGKTPPCTGLIIKNEIKEVMIASRDSFEKVNGTGIEKLISAGIKVTEGIFKKEALDLNKRFFTFHEKKRPYIILKWAQSIDTKIAKPGFSTIKISNDITNRLVHKWRSEEAAILVGTNTALHDNPMLTTRSWPGKNPVRIVIDKHLKLPETLHLFDNAVPTIIINTNQQKEKGNILYNKIAQETNVISSLIKILYQRQLTSLLVEGGARLHQTFIDEDCWDEARVITNNGLVIEEGIEAPILNHAKLISTTQINTDTICTYRNQKT